MRAGAEWCPSMERASPAGLDHGMGTVAVPAQGGTPQEDRTPVNPTGSLDRAQGVQKSSNMNGTSPPVEKTCGALVPASMST